MTARTSATEAQQQQPVPTGARAARKREAILQAARTVFLREGFGAGVDQLAAEAGVSKVTIYNHFGSKENLFNAVIGQTLDEALEVAQSVIQARLAESDDVRTDLLEACRTWVAGLTTPEVLALRNVIAGERHRFPELGATWQEEGPGRQHAALATALGRLDDRGLLRIPDMELAVLQLSGLVLSPHLVYGAYGTALDEDLAERLIQGGVDMFLHHYGVNS
ncbi:MULTISPECIES: TetR/AcrR family transcriptional regulator [unclassified Streptomyces]|uniref:TetR/AcrR family transcriptional regulator n=1 Tax=unclassified Streptomyces TaxID=2593676 RepID=UPI00061F69F4|nr:MULTISPECIES: TetR/AcrR family transcriptional regulator [unclassified Streptomyces]KJY31876.1 transcriptional regulator [Streptomyces sp. NRRL S-444]TDU77062.1 TetR family transcriptional regulator [Streptomyces sp. KS 21]THA34943.1 TetR/AcrR family transcriptional regulator [Streptomyces sp. A1547]